jgi:acetoin utilization deacetylase AcuC-like enzyme
MTTALIYDPLYLRHDTGFHPENAERLRAIAAALDADQELQAREDLLRCHGEELVAQVRTSCERGRPFMDLDTVICPESFNVARLAAGAAITGIDEVFQGRASNAFAFVRPPGHHATAHRSMGFCLFNNAAVGARYAQAVYGAERVLIIDWDVHHGNGTQEIFYQDPSVFYFSTHQFPFYPGSGAANESGAGRGEGFTLNVPLPENTAAHSHRQAFLDALRLIERDFPPDFIIISAGFDARRDDPLGGLMLEDADFAEMTKAVLDMADRHAGGRVVSLLEGGYNIHTLGETVRTHVRALAG